MAKMFTPVTPHSWPVKRKMIRGLPAPSEVSRSVLSNPRIPEYRVTIAAVFIVSEDTAICDPVLSSWSTRVLQAESFSCLDQCQEQVRQINKLHIVLR